MFWKYNLITASHIETLLQKENVTLKELMDEEDILQECKAQSQKLIDFLVRPESLEEMVTLITQEPDEHIEEKIQYKYSNIACELLTFDVASINDAVSGNEALLNKLYAFLGSKKPLNPLLASFFSKTFGKIFTRKTELMFDYLSQKPDFVSLLLHHIETSAIMDLLIRLMTYSETVEMRSKVINWLNEQSIIQQLVALIDPVCSEDRHCNAAQALCDMIRFSREQMSLLQEKAEPNPLLETIESVEVVSSLLKHLFSGEKKESVFVNGISVLLALLEFKKHGSANSPPLPTMQSQSTLHTEQVPHNSSPFFFRNDGPEQMTALDAERLAKGVNNVLEAFLPHIAEFHNLLLAPPAKQSITLTIGCLDPPLGYTRLEVTRLFVALVATNTHSINCQLATLQTIQIVMELFFKYSWNNFLHTQIDHAIERILTNTQTIDSLGNKVHPLLDQLLLSYRITEKILDVFQEMDKEACEEKNVSRGYIGHLTKIANHIAQNSESGVNSDLIKAKLKELPEPHLDEWEKFTVGTLADVNKKNTTPLVSGVISSCSVEEEAVHFKGLHFRAFDQDSSLQVQHLSGNFVDQFCFAEEFNEADENLSGQLDRLAQVHFSPDDNKGSLEMFEQVCEEKGFGNNPDSDEELWEEKGYLSFWYRKNKQEKENNSSDSDEEEQEEAPIAQSGQQPAPAIHAEEVKMEIDNQDGWTANFDSVPMEVGPTPIQNPWEAPEQPSSTSDVQTNWADFSSFSTFSSANAEESGEISSTTAVAMETSEVSTNEKFVSSSEVSSTSEFISDALAKESSSSGLNPFEEQACKGPSSSSSSLAPANSIGSSDSEATASNVNEKTTTHNFETDPLHERDICASSSAVQNGPV